MQRLVWLSDLHLNFVRDPRTGTLDEEWDQFLRDVAAATPDGILISGDLAEAPELCDWLARLETELPAVPVRFVLGNHDFYRGSIAAQRVAVRDWCRERSRFDFLTVEDAPIFVTPRTAIVGHDGWADGRFGDHDWSYDSPDVRIADYEHIEELIGLSKEAQLQRLHALGDEGAQHVGRMLAAALPDCEHAIVVTHVPPFREACLHRGRICDMGYLPHFACRALGEVLLDAAARFPTRRITVLCGHTHHAAHVRPAANLQVIVAAAEYGRPIVQRVLDVE